MTSLTIYVSNENEKWSASRFSGDAIKVDLEEFLKRHGFDEPRDLSSELTYIVEAARLALNQASALRDALQISIKGNGPVLKARFEERRRERAENHHRIIGDGLTELRGTK